MKESENIVIEQVKYPLEIATNPVEIDPHIHWPLKDLDDHITSTGAQFDFRFGQISEICWGDFGILLGFIRVRSISEIFQI